MAITLSLSFFGLTFEYGELEFTYFFEDSKFTNQSSLELLLPCC